MRKKNQIQMPLTPCGLEHLRPGELGQLSEILDAIPTMTELVLQDLTHDRAVVHRHFGADGMGVEQMLRAALIFQKNNSTRTLRHRTEMSCHFLC
jgi:hypothetical protein